jgi:hypothetical protein
VCRYSYIVVVKRNRVLKPGYCLMKWTPHGSNGSISITATLILYDRSGHKLIED